MNLNFASETFFNFRQLPTLSGKSANPPGSSEFFGSGRQEFSNENFIFSFDMFKGDASFKPVDWRFKVTGVASVNFLRARKNGIVSADLAGQIAFRRFQLRRGGLRRMAVGRHAQVLPFLRGKKSEGGRSPFFDTTSMRVGIQQFTSDFRGFVFSDSNLGARMFGISRRTGISTTWSISTCWRKTPTAS